MKRKRLIEKPSFSFFISLLLIILSKTVFITAYHYTSIIVVVPCRYSLVDFGLAQKVENKPIDVATPAISSNKSQHANKSSQIKQDPRRTPLSPKQVGFLFIKTYLV